MSRYFGGLIKGYSQVSKLDESKKLILEYSKRFKTVLIIDADQNEFRDYARYEAGAVMVFVTCVETTYETNYTMKGALWILCEPYQKSAVMKCFFRTLFDNKRTLYLVCSNSIFCQNLLFWLRYHGIEDLKISKDGIFTEKISITVKNDIVKMQNNVDTKVKNSPAKSNELVFFKTRDGDSYFIYQNDTYNTYEVTNYKRDKVYIQIRTNEEGKILDELPEGANKYIDNFNSLVVADGFASYQITVK
jgi:hypothetical protein